MLVQEVTTAFILEFRRLTSVKLDWTVTENFGTVGPRISANGLCVFETLLACVPYGDTHTQWSIYYKMHDVDG